MSDPMKTLSDTVEESARTERSSPTGPVVIEVPETRLSFTLRGSGPAIALVGSPMTADEFAPVAEVLAVDHAVLTHDPRGHGGSVLRDPSAGSTPEQRADDLAALVRHAGIGPVAVLGSSGGAVTALAFAQRHPELATTIVAHEPPLLELLDDRDDQRRQTEAMRRRHADGDVLGAWRMFFAQAGIEVPDGMLEGMFGGEREQRERAEEAFWFATELPASVCWEPDRTALRRGPRIVLGIGEESAGQLCERTTEALAERLDLGTVRFPGDHTGFVDHPQAFAARLREVLG
ncbi:MULTISPECIES: alpha/beta fold hydrolase [unclassified Microbacterium]|uniref:alpha/beta fold hydrolase n=1 Tax=unclassified Microbacterium TaxID=2609290 RepID=UPI00301015BC